MKEIHYCYCGRSDRHDNRPQCEIPRVRAEGGKFVPQGAQQTTCADCGWTYGTHAPTCSSLNGGEKHADV